MLKNFKRLVFGLTVFSLVLSFTQVWAAETINGAGATFPFPIYSAWAFDYNKETGVQLNYQSIGSGGGIRQITERTVDFGATDAPLKPEQLAKDKLLQFPAVIGGVVPVVNIAGVKAGDIRFGRPRPRRAGLHRPAALAAPAQLAQKAPATSVAPVHAHPEINPGVGRRCACKVAWPDHCDSARDALRHRRLHRPLHRAIPDIQSHLRLPVRAPAGLRAAQLERLDRGDRHVSGPARTFLARHTHRSFPPRGQWPLVAHREECDRWRPAAAPRRR